MNQIKEHKGLYEYKTKAKTINENYPEFLIGSIKEKKNLILYFDRELSDEEMEEYQLVKGVN